MIERPELEFSELYLPENKVLLDWATMFQAERGELIGSGFNEDDPEMTVK